MSVRANTEEDQVEDREACRVLLRKLADELRFVGIGEVLVSFGNLHGIRKVFELFEQVRIETVESSGKGMIRISLEELGFAQGVI